MSGYGGGSNFGGGYLHAPKNKDSDWLRPSERLMLANEEERKKQTLNCFSLTATPHSFSPQFKDDFLLHRSRSASISSESSANSTGTVCESDSNQIDQQIVPFGLGIKPGKRSEKSSSPIALLPENKDNRSMENSEPSTSIVDWKSDKAVWRSQVVLEQPSLILPQETVSSAAVQKLDGEDDSLSLVSTVSGSGIDFFRKFVQRKGSNCKDCEQQFRRDVLIDRLVSDSQNIKAGLMDRQSKASTSTDQYCSSNVRSHSEISDRMTTTSLDPSEIVSSLCLHDLENRTGTSRCKTHQDYREDTMSRSSGLSRQSSIGSSISGTGLLFLRNYLKRKKSKSKPGCTNVDPKDISAFNIVPVPFPPPSDFYGPVFLQEGTTDNMSEGSSGRRLSVCSTVADLLNEDFDCDDSELKNLDWEEWDEPLPDDISYDDLVSVISESFYSDDPDFSDLCELDWEGRKTVVANDRQIVTPNESTNENTTAAKSVGHESEEVLFSCSKNSPGAVEAEGHESTAPRSKYGSFKSSTFLQDLEAELELPPMTPVSDEKEEAVRAISRTISKYIRTSSNSSYSSSDPIRTISRLSTGEQICYKKNGGTEEGRSMSRLSAVYSPALSDCLPELAPAESASPTHLRRPLSQLLQYDAAPPPTTGSPQFTVSPSPDFFRSDDTTPHFSTSHTPSTIRSLHSTRPPSQSGQFSLLTRPSSYSQDHETSPQEPWLRATSLNPQTSRDTLLATNYSHTPPSPGSIPRTIRPYLRHSSSNSTDSGCPLFDDKVASLSPTPSPRNNIETLSSNRNKLASFWERSVGLGTSTTEIPLAWLSNNDESSVNRSASCFQPFGSENSLSTTKNDRLSHFLDVTRRAAAEKNSRGRMERKHRASTGSDCSELLDKVNPLSPQQLRRRDSFTEHFV